MVLIKRLTTIIVWIPTVIAWTIFVLGFKLLGRIDGIGRSWSFLGVYSDDTYLGKL